MWVSEEGLKKKIRQGRAILRSKSTVKNQKKYCKI
jgi:hypothetical protein